MNYTELGERQNISNDIKMSKIYSQFRELLNELKKKELSQKIVAIINDSVRNINSSTLMGSQLRKLIKENQTSILKQTQKELKIVPQNYYRNLWMLSGFTVFGLPIGIIFGAIIGNMGLLVIGLPIGMAIGATIGLGMDKKAYKEGRQLNLEIKY